ncbi:MAG: ATP-binding protein [Syntrophomonadaceae bacterium]|nr:ATP-binding protein [Syntrophomonadaceae bacterium]
MQAQELFSSYFDPKYSGLPYSNDREYLTDLLSFLDIILNVACAYKGMNESNAPLNVGDAHLRGMSISPAEIVDSLLSYRLNERSQGVAAEIKRQVEIAYTHIEIRLQASITAGFTPRVKVLSKKLRLTDFERFLLLLSLSSACDRKYESIFAFLHNNVKEKLPTKGLAITLYKLFFDLEDYHCGCTIKGEGNFFRFLTENPVGSNSEPGLADKIVLNRRASGFVFGINKIDQELEDFVTIFDRKERLEGIYIRHDEYQRIQNYMEDIIYNGDRVGNVLNLYVQNGIGKKHLLKHAAQALHVNLIFIDYAKLRLQPPNSIRPLLDKVYLEYLLTGSVPCFINMDQEESVDDERDVGKSRDMRLVTIIEYIENDFWLAIWISRVKEDELTTHQVHLVSLELPMLTVGERMVLWDVYSQDFNLAEDIDIVLCANQYILTPKGIIDVLDTANSLAGCEARSVIERDDILQGVKQRSVNQLGRFATLINAVFTWDDLVIDQDQKHEMQIICNQIKYRNVVGEEWGFHAKTPYGRGLCALFYGSPGTGKTMAVQVMANELGLDLYRIDMSQLVSKYIGEPEKNISDLFRKAKNINALLFFDEADSLFAKRSEVKDSNDRYANADTAHLLQKLEEYEGISILATNYVNNIDDAFKRRIKFMINFVFPTPEVRLKLWETVLPKNAVLDEELDFEFFANNFDLAGSNIKDILLTAAYIAASEHTGLANRHVVEAIKLNFKKYGKILTSEDFGYLGITK